jgi:hypothetical protein
VTGWQDTGPVFLKETAAVFQKKMLALSKSLPRIQTICSLGSAQSYAMKRIAR